MAPVVVQRLMGHTDITITLNTYTDILDRFKEKEIEKVNNYYLDENLIEDTEKLLLDIDNNIISEEKDDKTLE